MKYDKKTIKALYHNTKDAVDEKELELADQLRDLGYDI